MTNDPIFAIWAARARTLRNQELAFAAIAAVIAGLYGYAGVWIGTVVFGGAALYASVEAFWAHRSAVRYDQDARGARGGDA